MYGNDSAGGNDTVACTNGYTYDPAGFDPNGGTITMQVGLYGCHNDYIWLSPCR